MILDTNYFYPDHAYEKNLLMTTFEIYSKNNLQEDNSYTKPSILGNLLHLITQKYNSTELDKYLNEPLLYQGDDIYLYWRTREKTMPVMYI